MEEGWNLELSKRQWDIVCRVCGDKNKNLCKCAKEKWFKEQSFKNTPDQRWERIKETSIGVCAICPRCGGSSMSFCECAKKVWIKEEEKKNPFQY